MEYLIAQEIVDLISAPPPVEFPSRAVLRAMGVGQLKRTMNETGVYFDPKDVVEKEDMVQIFVNSGRICLTEPETTNDSERSGGPDMGYGHAARDRPRSFSVDMDNSDTDADGNDTTQANDDRQSATAAPPSIVVETVNENDESVTSPSRSRSEDDQNNVSTGETWDSNVLMEETSFTESPTTTTNTSAASASTGTANEAGVPASTTADACNLDEQQSASVDHDRAESAATAAIGSDLDDPMETDASDSVVDSTEALEPAAAAASPWALADNSEEGMDESESKRKRPRRNEDTAEHVEEDNIGGDDNDETSQFRHLSISDMRNLAQEQGIDLSHCIERSEMEERLSSASSVGRSSPVAAATATNSEGQDDDDGNNNNNNSQANNVRGLSAATFQDWSVSHLKACARSVDVDLSRCTTHDDMVAVLLAAATERPHVANYLSALSPLMGMKTSELRALARDWGVKVSHCLEKGEMVSLLASASRRNEV